MNTRNKTKGTKQIISVLFQISFFFYLPLKSQVYNYDPIRYTNSETNPSYLACDKTLFTASYIHQGSTYSSNKFNTNAAKISLFSPAIFTGIGLVANQTQLNDTTSYNYVGLGAAYRTILFGSIYTKVGLLYKMINVRSAVGHFDYYSFTHSANDIQNQKTINNGNISVSFSSARDRYFLSIGVLNNVFSQHIELSNPFPNYYYLTLGDFGKIIRLENWEISYSAFIKFFKQENQAFSHYITILYNGFRLTRYSGIKYGLRAGLTDSNYLQFNPTLAYYQKTNRKHMLVYQYQCDLGIYFNSLKSSYPATNQFNLTYLF